MFLTEVGYKVWLKCRLPRVQIKNLNQNSKCTFSHGVSISSFQASVTFVSFSSLALVAMGYGYCLVLVWMCMWRPDQCGASRQKINIATCWCKGAITPVNQSLWDQDTLYLCSIILMTWALTKSGRSYYITFWGPLRANQSYVLGSFWGCTFKR